MLFPPKLSNAVVLLKVAHWSPIVLLSWRVPEDGIHKF